MNKKREQIEILKEIEVIKRKLEVYARLTMMTKKQSNQIILEERLNELELELNN